MTFRVLHRNVFWIDSLCKHILVKLSIDTSTTPLGLQTPLVASIDTVENRRVRRSCCLSDKFNYDSFLERIRVSDSAGQIFFSGPGRPRFIE
jgi:hypothetical protein